MKANHSTHMTNNFFRNFEVPLWFHVTFPSVSLVGVGFLIRFESSVMHLPVENTTDVVTENAVMQKMLSSVVDASTSVGIP